MHSLQIVYMKYNTKDSKHVLKSFTHEIAYYGLLEYPSITY